MKKTAIMYGAGNIGRGFIAQLFYMSGYETVFIDIDDNIINLINQKKSYPLYITSFDRYNICEINNVSAINANNEQAFTELFLTSDLLATAVGVNVLPKIVDNLVMGLKYRWKNGNFNPFNVLICENLVDSDQYLAKLICEKLTDEEISILNKTVGFIQTSVSRMVPSTPKDILQINPLIICVEPYHILPVDKDRFKGEIPMIYGMKPYSSFDFYIKRKLFMHNMAHSVCAYLGYIYKYEYIWQAVEDPQINKVVLGALEQSAAALSRQFDIPMDELKTYYEDLIERFKNKLLRDTVKRVGRDPIRKLASNDRLIGACLMCYNNNILPLYISIGIAAALLFNDSSDPAAVEIYTTVNEIGVKNTLEFYSGVELSDKLILLINKIYNALRMNISLDKILELYK